MGALVFEAIQCAANAGDDDFDPVGIGADPAGLGEVFSGSDFDPLFHAGIMRQRLAPCVSRRRRNAYASGMQHVIPQIDRYLPVIESLANQALTMAVDGSPTRPAAGQKVCSLMACVPAARALVNEDDAQSDLEPDTLRAALQDPATRLTDGFGHHRPIYRALAWHLLACAGAFSEVEPGDPPSLLSEAFHDVWWQRWTAYQAGRPVALVLPEGEGPVHEQTLNDAPEDWTYRDLAALHAVFCVGLAKLQGEAPAADGWLERCQKAARFHLNHTQPDYTTYQPWGLPVFLLEADTAFFAEQQLHDVQSHLHLSGPGCALVPGLLLADSVHLLRRLRAMARKQSGPSAVC